MNVNISWKGYRISLATIFSSIKSRFRYQPRRWHRNKFFVYRFDTVPGHDGTGSDAERAERLSTGEAFALSKRVVQSDIPVLARRSRPEAGIPNAEKGSGPASRGQYERTLRGPREFRIRMHRLSIHFDSNEILLEIIFYFDLSSRPSRVDLHRYRLVDIWTMFAETTRSILLKSYSFMRCWHLIDNCDEWRDVSVHVWGFF